MQFAELKEESRNELLEVSPTGGALGAEICGIDLRKPIGKVLAAKLRNLLYRHQVLIFRGQEIGPDDQLRLTQCFGKVDPGPTGAFEDVDAPNDSAILYLSNQPGSPTSNFGSTWHSDGLAYFKTPQGVTILHCLACPENGGETLFANQYLAFEATSPGVQAVLKKLFWRVSEQLTYVHPLVRRHPRTGRYHFYCDPDATHLLGMKTEESKFFFDLIAKYRTSSDCVFEHKWRAHDVVLWENSTTLHKRATRVDFDTQGLRVMHRTTTVGSVVAADHALDVYCVSKAAF